MRGLAAILVLAFLWPAAAAAVPSVEELVAQAVDALSTTSYEARMRFLSHFEEDGENVERVVHVYHVAPELYRVEPLLDGDPMDTVYIENAVELIRLHLPSGSVEELPVRQFYVNDSLTIKFLRDLGKHPSTVVFEDAFVGSYPVVALRQDMIPEKPYMITVGLDKHNYFPLFLLVLDGTGQRRVYYEMEAIEYSSPSALSDGLFMIPEQEGLKRTSSPRSRPLYPNVQLERDKLPLYPGWLPRGYRLEGISVLEHFPAANGESEPSLVYQLEVYGPQLDLLSIFQTPAEGLDLALDPALNQQGTGFFIQEQDGWLVAVLASPELPIEVLVEITNGLTAGGRDEVLQLIEETLARDEVFQQAADYAK